MAVDRATQVLVVALWAVAVSVYAPSRVAAQQSPAPMTAWMSGDNFAMFYQNGVGRPLTKPTSCTGCSQATTYPEPNYQNVCWTCPYGATFDAEFGDVFGVIGVNTGGPESILLNLKWNGVDYGSGTNWLCSQTDPQPQTGIRWNQKGYDWVGAGFKPAVSCGTYGVAPWVNGALGAVFNTANMNPLPHWMWGTDKGCQNDDTPATSWTNWCVWTLPAPTPILSTVNGLANGQAYTGSVDNRIGVYKVRVAVGPFATSVRLTATLANSLMTLKWSTSTLGYVATSATETIALQPSGSPTIVQIYTLSVDGQTGLTYEVTITRLTGKYILTNHFTAEGASPYADTFCTGTSNGANSGDVTINSVGAPVGTSNYVFPGTANGNIQIAQNGHWMWALSANDFRLSMWVKFTTVKTGACSGATFGNPLLSKAQGVAAADLRWVFGVCDNPSKLAFVHSTASVETVVSVPWTPDPNVWYNIGVSRADFVWTFTVGGVTQGSPALSVVLVPTVPAANALFIGGLNGGTSYFAGQLDDVQLWTGEWLTFAKVDRTLNMADSLMTAGYGSPTSPVWFQACGTLEAFLGTGDDTTMRWTALDAEPTNVVDYFRPKASVGLCLMLTSYNQHRWCRGCSGNSVSGTYVAPTTNDAAQRGGSGSGFPVQQNIGDPRTWVSFWGSNNAAWTGGCCTTKYDTAQDWGVPYALSVLAPRCPLPNPCYNNGPCLNGGVCTLGATPPTASFSCNCAGTGYTGAQCQTLVDNCALTPCLNGATCTNGINQRTCACLAGGYGTTPGVAGNCATLPRSSLTSLTVAGFALNPAFTPSGTSYQVTVSNSSTTAVTVGAILADAQATVAIGINAAQTGTSTRVVPLVYGGVTNIAVVARAQSPWLSTTYNIAVTQQLSEDPSIATLVCPGWTVTGEGMSWAVTVGTLTTSITCTATTRAPLAQIRFDADPFVVGTVTQTFPGLAFLGNNHPLQVRTESASALGQAASSPATFIITRPPSANNTLTWVTIRDNLAPPTTLLDTAMPPTTQQVSVPHEVTAVYVTAAADVAATMTLNGNPLSSGVTSVAQPLLTPSNVAVDTPMTLVVRAQNGATRTYTFTVRTVAIPTVVATSPCTHVDGATSPAVPPLKKGVTRSLYLTVPSGQNREFLHVAAESSNADAPINLFLRSLQLPVIGTSQFDTQSQPAIGVKWTRASLAFLNAGTYYLSYQIAAASPIADGDTVQPVFDVCSYAATPTTLFASVPATVLPNQWALFSYTLTAGQYFATLPMVTYTSSPARGSTDTRYLQTYAMVDPPPQQPLQTFLGALQSETNPVSGVIANRDPLVLNRDYQATASISAPAAGVRVIFAIFADPTAVSPQASYSVDVQVVPPFPVITSSTPTTSGITGGTTYTITGYGFEPAPQTTMTGEVRIGGLACLNPVYNAARQILCQLPVANQTMRGFSQAVTVTLYGRQSHESPNPFIYDDSCILYNVTGDEQACFQCQPGSYSTAAQTTFCANCTVGTFAYGYAQTTCSQCGAGTYTPGEGAASCTPCPTGYYSTAVAASSCLPCDEGKYSRLPGQVFCPLCPSGSYSVGTNNSVCAACSPGKVQPNSGRSTCVDCAQGSYMSLGSQPSCLPCVAGTFANITGLANCFQCPPGWISDGNAVACTQCDFGKYVSAAGQSECLPCAAGTYAPSRGLSSCLACPAGTAGGGEGLRNCTTCPAGYVALTNSTVTCTPCGVGTYTPGPNVLGTPCLPCPAGQYQPATGQDRCVPCDPGTFLNSTGGVQCQACALGSAQPLPGFGYCPQCPPGFIQPQPGRTTCQPCPGGQAQPSAGQTQCIPCQPGYAAASTNSTNCAPCPAGSFSTGGAQGCQPCAVGQFASTGAATACQACAAGEFANTTGLATCLPCPAGAFNTGPAVAGASVGMSTCFGCAAGSYQSNVRQTQCLPCPLGTATNASNSVECTPCAAGTYQDDLGQTECSLCDPGTATTATGATEACPACLPGSYAAGSGNSGCALTDIGFEQPNARASAQSACSPGYYAGTPGQAQCTPCGVGTNMPFGQATVCNQCESGKFQPTTGQVACVPCRAGTATNLTGVQQCSLCTPGTATSYTNQLTCQACPMGYAVATSGADFCPGCEPGFYADALGLAQCLRCTPGTYNDQAGQANCTACPGGKFQSREAQQYCFDCPAGTFSHTRAAECQRCGARTVSPSSGASTCYACDQNARSNDANTLCMCEVGYAATYANASDGSGMRLASCQSCPACALCDTVGTNWDTMQTRPGCWSAVQGEYYRCLVATQCVGFATAADPAQCAPNFVGPLCSYCDEGYSQSIDGKCLPCSSSLNSSGYTVIIILIFLGGVIGCLYVMVRSGEQLMDLAFVEEERMRREAAGYATEKFDRIMERNRHGNIITLDGAPSPHPDFTFKLKILLGFLQIVTNLSFGLAIQFPPTFTAFLNWFNPANMDFIRFSSVDCLHTWSYYYRVGMYIAAPPFCLLCLATFYYLPMHCYFQRQNKANLKATLSEAQRAASQEEADDAMEVMSQTTKRETRIAKKKVRRNFWKMLFFCLFLLYPSLSAAILRMYICIDVQGRSYMVADMSTECRTSTWNLAAILVAPTILLYPIGIPAFFFYMLFRYRDRLEEAGVRAQLGFLYDAYEHPKWWFEMVDMLYKLVVTSMVAFLPATAQLQAAMGVVFVYLASVLVFKPFLRKGDDQLILFALIEIVLLLLAGHTFNDMDGYSTTYDVLMSVVLIGVFCLFVAYFLLTAGAVLIKMVRNSDFGKARGMNNTSDTAKSQKDKRNRKDGTIEQEMAALTIDRRTMLRTGLTSRRDDNAAKSDTVIMQVRNPMFRADATTAGGVLYDDLDGTEMIAMVNPMVLEGAKSAVNEEEAKKRAEEEAVRAHNEAILRARRLAEEKETAENKIERDAALALIEKMTTAAERERRDAAEWRATHGPKRYEIENPYENDVDDAAAAIGLPPVVAPVDPAADPLSVDPNAVAATSPTAAASSPSGGGGDAAAAASPSAAASSKTAKAATATRYEFAPKRFDNRRNKPRNVDDEPAAAASTAAQASALAASASAAPAEGGDGKAAEWVDQPMAAAAADASAAAPAETAAAEPAAAAGDAGAAAAEAPAEAAAAAPAADAAAASRRYEFGAAAPNRPRNKKRSVDGDDDD